MNCGWKEVLVFCAYQILESWLGKTDKTVSGSVPELVMRLSMDLFKVLIKILMDAFNKLFKKGKENG